MVLCDQVALAAVFLVCIGLYISLKKFSFGLVGVACGSLVGILNANISFFLLSSLM